MEQSTVMEIIELVFIVVASIRSIIRKRKNRN